LGGLRYRTILCCHANRAAQLLSAPAYKRAAQKAAVS
jgi:hypothetical protein